MRCFSQTLPLFLVASILLAACQREQVMPMRVQTADLWQDQILYFIVTDRFMDGDSTNNDQGVGEYRKGEGSFWNGGDLRGIEDRLDYIEELGATSIWITPPVANQWRNPQKTGTGNHGYWATNFMEVDKHLGSLDDYRSLVQEVHRRDMRLIQDVVVNHLGDFYTYEGPYNPDDVTEHFKLHDEKPTQYPFYHNDANNPEDLALGVYRFTPNFNDHSDTIKKRTHQFADLDDLNTDNELVRKTLRQSYNFWIREVGVDGFRFDTPHMVEHELWHDFLYSGDREHPGVERFARQLGKDDFFTFGETALFPAPLDETQTRKIARYLGTDSKPEMQSVLNFPLTQSIGRVFQELRPTHLLTYRLESQERIFPHPEFLLNFIDNHDGARFISQAGQSSMRQALLFIMTIPGVPIIYYGTEQELTIPRQTMFAGGYGTVDDQFNTDSDAYSFVRSLTFLRKNQKLLRRGSLQILADDETGPGAFVYQLSDGADRLYVLLNTSDRTKLLAGVETGLDQRQQLTSIFALDNTRHEAKLSEGGVLNMLLPAKCGMVMIPQKAGGEAEINRQAVDLQEFNLSADKLAVVGTSSSDQIALIINGDYERAIEVVVDQEGFWQHSLSISHLPNGTHQLAATTFLDGQLSISDPLNFEVTHETKSLVRVTDPAGDDLGPEGTYKYPAHPSYHSQMDFRSVEVKSIGTNLLVEVTMDTTTQTWLPPNGFDHALINIYIDLPDRVGSTELPWQNASMPDRSNWDYLVSTAGFNNALYTSGQGATATPLASSGPSATVTTDVGNHMISFRISAESMNFPPTLAGIQLYLTTWAGGPGNLRDLKPVAENWSLGGGNNTDIKIMDEVGPIKI